MKRPIPLLATMALFMYPSLCLASYLVQLTNGHQLITDGYWEEGAQIRFYAGGGAVAVPKAAVRQIRETDMPASSGLDRKPVIFLPRAPQRVPEAEAPAEKPAEGIQKAGAVASLADYRDQRRRLKAELDQALEAFRQASGHRDFEAKKKAIRRMTEVSGKILKLSDDLRAKHNGVLPAWWEEWSPSHSLLPTEKL